MTEEGKTKVVSIVRRKAYVPIDVKLGWELAATVTDARALQNSNTLFPIVTTEAGTINDVIAVLENAAFPTVTRLDPLAMVTDVR